MKRFLSFMLIVLVLLPIFSFSVSAAKSAYDTVKDGIMSCSSSIAVDSYNLTRDGLFDLMESVLKNEPMLFHCGDSYGLSMPMNSDKVLSVRPSYDITGNALKTARDYVEAELEYILNSVPEGLDDFEKAAYLHDYICVNFAYDLNLDDGIVYDIYELFKQDVGVCMAYSLLYDELLCRLGIESRAIISPAEELNHMWNEVKLGGKWYQVDVTWDDPVADRFGRASHANFLDSDAAMSVTHNKLYESEYPCTDTKYDDIDWKYNDRPFGFANGDMYLLIDNEIWKMDFHTGEGTRMMTAGQRYWYAPDGSYLGYCAGFGSYDNWLYYNTDDDIMRYNPKTNTIETVYTPDKSEGVIIGMYLSGNKINYLASTTGKTQDGIKYEITIDDVLKPDDGNADSGNGGNESDNSNSESDNSNTESDNSNTESDNSNTESDDSNTESDTDKDAGDAEVFGDVNKDGKVSAADYVLVKRACLGTYKLSDEEKKVADIDRNNEVAAVDYVLVKRIVLGTYTVKSSDE